MLRRALGLAATVAVPCLVQAQAFQAPLAVSVAAGLTATDNGNLAASGLERPDLIASLRPKLSLMRRAPRFQFDLEVAATLLAFARSTQPNAAQPDGLADIKATLVDDWAYFDATAQWRQAEQDPYGPRADDATGANRRTQGLYRLSPHVEHPIAPDVWLLARQDATLTTDNTGVGSELFSQHTLLALQRKPVPLGGSLEWSRVADELRGTAGSGFALESLRARADLAVRGEWVGTVQAGVDQVHSTFTDHRDPMFGLGLQWAPGERTRVKVELDKRYFGPAGTLQIRHRLPFMSIEVAASRQPLITSQATGPLASGTDLRGYLDGILTTRFPDPVARANLVDNLVTSRGLNTQLAQPIDLVAGYPQLQSEAHATWVLLGRRDTASVTLYTQTLRQIARDSDPLSALLVNTDSRQAGGSVRFNHKLSPSLACDLSGQWSRIEGLATSAGDKSRDYNLRLSFSQDLSTRTVVIVGTQRYVYQTNVAEQASYRADLLFVSLNHRL